MKPQQIEQAFRDKVCASLRLESEGSDRYRVVSPFLYGDGDHLSIVLRRNDSGWVLTDEASTYMHLSYELDDRALDTGTRQKIISDALTFFGIEDDDGELRVAVEADQYGDALYSLVQAMLRISDVTFLSRERVASAFMEDFRKFLSRILPEDRRTFEWSHPKHDPKQLYSVDCYVNGTQRRPIAIYGLTGDSRVRDATITLHQFESWGLELDSVGIFEDMERISRKPLARFADVCGKLFSSLPENEDRINKHLGKAQAI